MAELPPLPPGFVLDTPPQSQPQAQQALPPLPDGFVLDSAPVAQDTRSTLGAIGDRVTEFAKGLSTTRLSDVVKGMAESAKSGVTLPGDVYAGRVDPLSEEGQSRAWELAQFASPISAGSRARQVAPQSVPQVARDAAESGVNLTAGQRTGNPSLLSREDAAFGGAYGARAQEVAQAARARQMDELFRAREGVGDMAGRGVANLERPADAGGIVADAVKANAEAARQGFKQKYETAFSSTGSFKPEAFEGMSGRITESLTNRADPIIIDDVLTPAANRALGELDKIQNLKLGTTGQPAAGDAVTGVNLRGVDQARKKLVAFYSAAKANPTDARAMQGIIREFDDQIEQSVLKGLFEGDEKFLAALKDARSEFATYQKTFKKQNSLDDAGRVLETMVRQDVTPEQVANYIYGSSKVGANATNVRVVGRLKELLGEDSPQWAAIRQGAWQKLTGTAEGKTPLGPQAVASRIAEFTSGDGKTFARHLFSPEEITAMQKHANIERALSSKAGTANPPNSGNRLAGLLRESFGAIGAMLGAGAGGPQGAAAGYAAGKTAGGVGDFVNAAQTRALYRGQEPTSLGQRLQGAGSAAGRQLAPPTAIELLKAQSRKDP